MMDPLAAPPSQRRLVVVDDSTLFRQGVSRLLGDAGMRVVAEVSNVEAVHDVVSSLLPDAVLLDIRMPPTHTDEGLRCGLDLHRSFPKVGVLLLSTYAEGLWAQRLLEGGAAGLGYLLKDRVDDVRSLIDAVDRVSTGGTVVDPDVIARLLALATRRSDLDVLSTRERTVLALMAEGLSNAGIGRRLYLSPRTVEAHVAAIFTKLPLDGADAAMNRRVLAVLAFLRAVETPG